MEIKSNLHYKKIGNGFPVLFLHGFLESMSMWDNFELDEFPFESMLIDLPGHGNTPLTDDEEPSLEFMVFEIIHFLDEQGINEFHVVGHSMGGYVALLLKERDLRCKKVILLNSNFWDDSDEKKKDRIRVADIVLKAKDLFINEAIPGLFYRHSREDKVVQELIREAKRMQGVSIAYASLAMRSRADKKELIKANPNDFLIIHGKQDPLTSAENLTEMTKNINIEIIELELTGHMAHVEEPDKAIHAIKEFLIKKRKP